jgi:hypothetical protein
MTLAMWGTTPQGSAGQTASGSQPKSNAPRIIYRNKRYGFELSLPKSWEGFSVVVEAWHANADEASGPELLIRHPDWDERYPRQDIPIMVFTRQQWKRVAANELTVGAAPFGPGELGHNRRYVFAIPPRYNYAFLEGYEEVDEILGEKDCFHTLLNCLPLVVVGEQSL